MQYDPPVDRVFIRQIYSAAVNWWPGVATSPPHVKPSKSDHLITSLAEVSMTFILYVQSGNYYTWTRGSEWTIFFSSGNVAEVITAIYSSETLILQIFVFRIISDHFSIEYMQIYNLFVFDAVSVKNYGKHYPSNIDHIKKMLEMQHCVWW